jgi:hypothetical protein
MSFIGCFPDLMPLYLLRYAIPDRHHMPAGVEIVYDNQHDVHGYRFTADMTSLHFPSSSIFKYCNFFPEEFSILVTLKVDDRTRARQECIFALIQRGRHKIITGLRLYKGRLQFDYEDRLTRHRRVTDFHNKDVFDGRWHTLVFVVTGNSITLRVDCGKPERKRLKRMFPALISTKDTNIHVGECNSGTKGTFTVSI